MTDQDPGTAVPAPGRTLITAKSDYPAAADVLLGRAEREVRIFDPALSEFRLETAHRIELVRSFLLRSPGNRLFIAVHDPEHIKRDCPRIMNLLAIFSVSMFIHRTEGDAARVQDCFVLADNSSFVRRPVVAQPRGVFVLDDPLEASGMRKRFDEIWESSVPGVSATTSGL